MFKITAFILAASLASCQTSPQSATASVEYACASATAALKTSIIFNAKLTPAQRATVSQAVAISDPICSQPTVPTLTTTAQAALNGALTQLTTVAAAASK